MDGLFEPTKKKILNLQTQGYYKLKQPKKNGIFVVFQEAFARATEKLALSSKFIDLALRRQKEDEIKPNTSPIIVIAETKLRRKQVDKKLNNVLSAVVTVRVGRGHGSGFLISTDGLILTNQHVVVGAKKVAVILNNGLEVVGEVLRTDKVRDVALVKVPVRIRTALPIRKKLATRLEKVYVIGTPLKESLGSTITVGIVSALRTDLKTGQILIQSDAPITGGNSGGFLLDEYGNVIGISVLSYIHGQNLNLFIPIGEALERLNIEIRPKDKIHRVVARPAFPLDLKALLATWMGPAVAAGRSTEYGYI